MEGQITLLDWMKTKANEAKVEFPDLAPVSTKSTKKTEISDFGQKIGGAKKDLWGSNDSSYVRSTDVSKKDVWPRPKWEKLYTVEHMDRKVIYYFKSIYDAIPVHPQYDSWTTEVEKEDVAESYVHMVDHLRKALEDTMYGEPYVGCLGHFLDEENLIIWPTPHTFACINGSRHFVTTKLVRALRMDPRHAAYDVKRKRFLYTDEEKVLVNYEFDEVTNKTDIRLVTDRRYKLVATFYEGESYHVRFAYGTTDPETVDPGNYVALTWVVSKTSSIIKCGFPTKEDAVKWVLAMETTTESTKAAAERSSSSRKKSYTIPHLSSVQRIGGEDYRKGKDATTDDYLKDFHFRGGEFGNWLGQEERQQVLNYGYDAFMDMAKALDVSPERITGDGKLSIAFGARGRGKALAHFEPDKCVINLTRMKGAGSLGHEMIHFIDYLCGRNLGFPGFMSQSLAFEQMPKSFRDLLNTIHHSKDFMHGAAVLDHQYAKSGNGYWSSDIELLARAGAVYLKDKLAEKGIQNDYLCGHAETVSCSERAYKGYETVYGYPRGEERKNIDHAFDLFFSEMKTRNII